MTSNNYQWNAEDYAHHSGAQQGWARELIAKLALTGSERVLDIGCGDGKVSAEIAGALPDGAVAGVDSSADMIAVARRRFPPENWPNLSFEMGDARHLVFDRRFDVVFSNAALHWVRNHAPVLAGIHRALKPGGRVLLQMGGRGNAADVLGVLDVLLQQDQWRPLFDGFEFPYGFYAPEEYTPWISAAGLSPRRVERIPKDMVYDDAGGLAGWIRTTWLPYLQRVPEARRDAFVEDVVARYLQRRPPDPQGRIHVAMVRLEVEALRPPGG